MRETSDADTLTLVRLHITVGGSPIWWEHQRVRPHRTPASAVALALAVGLGALLVGLSVAPQALPGDTFRVVPRTIAGAVADNPRATDRANATQTSMGGLASHAVQFAVIPIAAYAGPFRWLLGLQASIVALVTDRAVPRGACRGPPSR